MRSYYWHERVLLSTAQSITITQVVSLFIYLFIYLFIRRSLCACARRRLIKWTFFVFHFRRHRRRRR